MRIWITLSPLVALVVLTAVAACVEEVEDTRGGPREAPAGEADSAGVHLFVGPPGMDVTAARVDIERTTCNGEPYQSYSESFLLMWDAMVEEGAVDPDLEDVELEGSLFVALYSGCYNTTIQPVTKDGEPSAQCAGADADQVVVMEGIPTQVIVSLQCALSAPK